jgi:hypothetical protein
MISFLHIHGVGIRLDIHTSDLESTVPIIFFCIYL